MFGTTPVCKWIIVKCGLTGHIIIVLKYYLIVHILLDTPFKHHKLAIIPWNINNIHWNIAVVDGTSLYYFEPFSAKAKIPADFSRFAENIEKSKGDKLKCESLRYTTQKDDWSCGYMCLIVIISNKFKNKCTNSIHSTPTNT